MVPPESLTPAQRAARTAALAEWEQAQAANADRAEGRVNLCGLYAERGELATAERECRAAVRLNRWFAPGFVSLAEVLRTAGRETEAEQALRDGLEASPDRADLLHALGLSLARQKRLGEALVSLKRAAERGTDDPRHAYVYAVALHDAGRAPLALVELRKAQARHPANPDLLVALITYSRERGDLAAARDYAQRLVALDPSDPRARALLRELPADPGR
jgi:Tfp pilus assembly protein PilF